MPEPPLLGQTMASGQFAASDEMTIVTTSARNPQPFTILMNFQNDGTMSLQIFNQDQTSWTDQGRCRHGQMYDPVSNVCRDVFCAQGYVLRPQGNLINFDREKFANHLDENDLNKEHKIKNSG